MPLPQLTEEQARRARPRSMTAEGLRAWMAWHGIDQTALAKATKVNRRTVYNWLNAIHPIPRTVWPSLAQQFGDPLPPAVAWHAVGPKGEYYAVSKEADGAAIYTPVAWDVPGWTED